MDNRLATWVGGYVVAWDSNRAEDIGALFAEDATYRPEPYGEPWRGRDAIVREWLARADAPGDATFAWEPLVEADGLAVIQGRTVYREPPREYRNLWVLRFDAEGRCAEFTEWYMTVPRP